MRRSQPIHFPHRLPNRRSLLNIYRALRKRYGHRNWWPGETQLEIMVGAILTQNTAWKNVEKAIWNLKKENLLNLNKLTRIKKSDLPRLIKPAGYFNVKARRLTNFLRFLRLRYGGNIKRMAKVPLARLRNELLGVNGIGEETADSILLYALEKRSFVVDAYTRRVFSRHRYLKGSEKYQTIQNIFTSHLPRSISLYNDYHAQLVEVGKDYCRKTPRCELCPLRFNL